MNFLDRLLEWLHQLWPLRIVASYEKGVRFWLGQDTKELGTGLYAFLPWFGDIKIATVVPDVMDLGVHSITTKDDRTITFSANIAYEIFDARLMWTKVEDFQTSLCRMAEGHMASRIREWDYPELIASQKELERSLKNTLSTRAEKWGVRITDCWLTDLVAARQWRLFGASPLS